MSVEPTMDLLEQRVSAAVDLIAALREKVARLEHDLALARRSPPARTGAVAPDEAKRLADEVARLRAERAAARAQVQGLIREIDRAAG
jgi:uncharacterized small protein (DUF1192 family)